MSICAYRVAMCLVGIIVAVGDAAEPAVDFPATPAGALAGQFIAAINDESSNAVALFVRAHVPQSTGMRMTPEKWQQMMTKLRQQSGGLDLKRVLGSSSSSVTLLFDSRKGARRLGMEIGCDKADPRRAKSIELHPMPSPNGPRPKSLPKEKVTANSIPGLIAQHVDETFVLGLFSGVVLVASGDEVLLHKSWGMANRDLGITNRVDTRFGSASVGKMFTGVAIAQLVQSGQLKFDDTIASVLPDYPNRETAEKVTVHHLLTHSGGVADPFESPAFDFGFKAIKQSDYFPYFADQPLAFSPGTQHRYSNGGYVVLAAMIEKITRQSFADYICAQVFRPSGMQDTGCVATESQSTTIAAPHRRRMFLDPLGVEERRVEKKPEFKRTAAGMGGWQTTTMDLFRFARAVRTNALLSAEMTKTVTTGKVSVMGERVKYGYGFYDVEAKGDRMVGHSGGGGDMAVAAEVEILWDSGYTVVILSNYDLEETRRLAIDIHRFLRAQVLGGATGA